MTQPISRVTLIVALAPVPHVKTRVSPRYMGHIKRSADVTYARQAGFDAGTHEKGASGGRGALEAPVPGEEGGALGHHRRDDR